MATRFYQGVPWVDDALARAQGEGVADALTDVARGLVVAAQHDPTHTRARVARRGRFSVVLTDELVVAGYEIGGGEPEPVEEPERAKGRGPKSQRELIEWLADAGYPTVRRGGDNGGHYAVLGKEGQRLVTMSSTASDGRALANQVATCRRVLGIELRREQR